MVLFDIRWYQMPFCYILLWYQKNIFQRDFVCYHQGIVEASLTSPSSAWRSIPVNPGTMIDPTSTITNQSLGMCSFTTFVTTIHLGVILVRLPCKSLALRTFTMCVLNVFFTIENGGSNSSKSELFQREKTQFRFNPHHPQAFTVGSECVSIRSCHFFSIDTAEAIDWLLDRLRPGEWWKHRKPTVWKLCWLVGGLEHEWIMTFGNFMIPTDFKSYDFSEG